MDNTLIAVIGAVVALLGGIFAGKVLFAKNTTKQVEDAQALADKAVATADKIIADATVQAETLKEKKILEADQKFLKLKSEYEKEVNQRNAKIVEKENQIKNKEKEWNEKNASVQKQIAEYDTKKQNLDKQLEIVSVKRTELEKHQEEHIKRLEKVSNLSKEDARAELIEAMTSEARTKAMSMKKL